MITINAEWLQPNGLYKCPYCEKEYTKKGISSHIWRKHTDEGLEFTKNHDPNKGYKEGTRTAWQKGKKLSKEHKEKISNSLKGKTFSEERKIQLSASLKSSNIVGGYRKGSGRGKHGWYKGYWCDSSYELAFVIYNLEHDIKFIRNTKGFEYKFNGESFNYYPDFIMEDGSYIEIKGYEDDKCFAKYQYFPYKLIVLKAENLQSIFQYVIDKYGNDYIKLYE